MKKARTLPLLVSVVLFTMMILRSQACTSAAREGIQLCLNVVVPTLFPLIFLSSILTSSATGQPIRILSPLCKVFRIPPHCGHILIMGFLGGYPVGAASIHEAWKCGQISTTDAKRLLAYCSNAGPAFIFGIIGPLFREPAAPALLWLIHIFSAWLTSQLLPYKYATKKVDLQPLSINMTQSLFQSIRIIAAISGWVILFRVLISFLFQPIAVFIPQTLQMFVTGVIELTNGCLMLHTLESPAVRFVLAAILLALGGLCVAMQTIGVTGKLGVGFYLPGKLLQAMFSGIFAIPIASVLYTPFLSPKYTTVIMLCFLAGIPTIAMFIRKKL